jgi:hypothetical protein
MPGYVAHSFDHRIKTLAAGYMRKRATYTVYFNTI